MFKRWKQQLAQQQTAYTECLHVLNTPRIRQMLRQRRQARGLHFTEGRLYGVPASHQGGEASFKAADTV